MFFDIGSDIRWGGSEDLNKKLRRSVDFVSNFLNDWDWQDSIQQKVVKSSIDRILLLIGVRLFNADIMKEHNIRSFYRLDKKKGYLIIDMIFL